MSISRRNRIVLTAVGVMLGLAGLASADQVLLGIDDVGASDSQAFYVESFPGGPRVNVGPLVPGLDLEAMDVHEATGWVYGIAGDSPNLNPGNLHPLLVFDPQTGLGGPIIDVNVSNDVTAGSFLPGSGDFWFMVEGVGLHTIDVFGFDVLSPSTAIATPAELLDAEGIAWSPDGSTLYLTAGNKLYSWDGVSTSATLLTDQLPGNDAEALEFDLNGDLIAAAKTVVYRIDLDTMDTETLQTFVGADIETMTFTAVPEPATMALLGLGGLGVIIRRNR